MSTCGQDKQEHVTRLDDAPGGNGAARLSQGIVNRPGVAGAVLQTPS